MLAPKSYEDAAAALRDAAADGSGVRIRGAGTRLAWGAPAAAPEVELSTARLDAVVEHNAGDLTAVVQAGLPLERLREQLAGEGQMLAIDPPGAGTVGGLFATADSGPLRHRHGAPRDLVLGMTVALSDGTIARTGGKVIKNVAGYDLAKLFTGSFGTLGLILELAVRLHPLPPRTATAVARSEDPDQVARIASDLTHAQLEAQCLDVAWSGGEGRVLARFAGAEAPAQASAATALAGGEVVLEDEPLWHEQRARQRPAESIVVKVAGTQDQIAAQLRAAGRHRATLAGRAAYGLSWIALPPDRPDAVGELRRALAPSPCVVLDAPADVREGLDVWGVAESPALDLMRRVKRRFDPAGACAPGAFVGGI
ncbi:MAG: FAD-binding oxidoreductase [Thermoleophilaceae bacterium]